MQLGEKGEDNLFILSYNVCFFCSIMCVALGLNQIKNILLQFFLQYQVNPSHASTICQKDNCIW